MRRIYHLIAVTKKEGCKKGEKSYFVGWERERRDNTPGIFATPATYPSREAAESDSQFIQTNYHVSTDIEKEWVK